ncbi:MAG: GNAT family N-acetyltransferase [Verrucomicrobiota bacterium]
MATVIMIPAPRCATWQLQSANIDRVVAIHRESFPNFFLTSLGPRFLREFYASFPSDPTGMGFVACDAQGEVLGAVVGSLNPREYFKRLLQRRWWAFGLVSLAAILRQPSFTSRLLRAVFYRGEAPAGPVRALLSSVVVARQAQGQGVGRALVQRWLAAAQARGASGCFLTTDAQNNGDVNRFYLSLGWKLEANYTTRDGRKMNRYVNDFASPESLVAG